MIPAVGDKTLLCFSPLALGEKSKLFSSIFSQHFVKKKKMVVAVQPAKRRVIFTDAMAHLLNQS